MEIKTKYNIGDVIKFPAFGKKELVLPITVVGAEIKVAPTHTTILYHGEDSKGEVWLVLEENVLEEKNDSE